ncbi:MAG: riboflavin synthase [Actinomycetota bacterium]
MFTGIVEGTGRVVRLLRRGGGARLEVRAPGMLEGAKMGDSIAVNGACVTITALDGDAFACDLVPETLARTTLGMLQANEEVNLERPLRADGRLDGHIVQGHIDVVGVVRSRRRVGAQEMLEINVPFELTRYLAPKGSISLDGVSLTVVDVNRDRFRVALIPHTLSTTTLGKKIQGSTVNVEVDILSKYVERHIAARSPRPQPSLAELVKMPLRDDTGSMPAISGAHDAIAPGSPSVPPPPAPLARAIPPLPKNPPSPKVSSKPPAKPKAPPPKKKTTASPKPARPVHKPAARTTAPKKGSAKKAPMKSRGR